MTIVSNFNKDHAFSKKMSLVWDAYYREYFARYGAKTGDIINIRDAAEVPRYQVCGWDKLIIFEGRQQPIRIEEKTRRHDVYSDYFIRDNKFWIELEGNVEESRAGSAITNSMAEVWAYGFASAGENALTHAVLFNRKPVIEWMECNQPRACDIKYSATREGYRTKGRLVSGKIIQENIFIPLRDKQAGLFGWAKE
jgi:hypothetical protein